MALTHLAWPTALESEAQAYVTAANSHSQANFGEPFAQVWYPRPDVLGRWISPYYGPPAVSSGGPIEEPAEFPVLREHAELIEGGSIEWPEEEE